MKKPSYPTVTATVIDEDTMRYGGSAFKRERTCHMVPMQEEPDANGYMERECDVCGWIAKYPFDCEPSGWCAGCGARVERDG